MANLQFTIPQSSISLAHLDRGWRLHAHTYMLRADTEDLFPPANHVRSIYWQPIVLYDAADWNQAVGLNQVGKLPGEILLHGDDRGSFLQQRFRRRCVERPQVGKVHDRRLRTPRAQPLLRVQQQGRSEERRVGREWSARVSRGTTIYK